MKFKRMPIEAESPEERGYTSLICNLAESSVTDIQYQDLKFKPQELTLGYGDHRGLPELRALLAQEHGLKSDQILIVPGAAAGLFIVAISILQKQSQFIVQRPNYVTNIETPRLIECEMNYIDLLFEQKYQFDLYKLTILAKKKPALISITTPHNPTGMVLTEEELLECIEIAERSQSFLLVDETYRDLAFHNSPSLAATYSDKVISVSSMSKAYGLPGIRIGWIACKNRRLMELFLAAKEQIFISNSVLDEHLALHFMQNKKKFFNPIKKHIDQNFALLEKHINKSKNLEWIKPQGGVVCYPRIVPKINYNQFYDVLYQDYKTMVAPGYWFETEKRYMRIGYGWPDLKQLQNGLTYIEKTINMLNQ